MADAKGIDKARDETGQADPVLAEALKRFNDSWKYQEDNWHKAWDRDNKLYDSERVSATYQGQTDTFVPMVFSTIETMVSALNNANIRFDYKSGDPFKQVDAAPLNALVDEYWDDDGWDLTLEESFREALTSIFHRGPAGRDLSVVAVVGC